MRIVDRYVLRELAVPFVLGLGVFTSVLLIVRILKLIELVVNRGIPFLQVLRLFSYILPAFLEVTVPMALLLAILVAFGRLSSDSEVIAMRASGISLYRLLVPVGVFASIVAVLTLGLSVYVRPWGNFLVRTGLYEIVKARASAGIKPKIFNGDFAGLVIYVDRIDPPGNQLHGVLISDTRDPRLHNTVYAQRGLLQTREDAHALTMRLYDGGMFTAATSNDGYQDTRFSTYDITLDLDLAMAEMHSRPKDPSEMGLGELRETIAERRAAQQTSFVEQVELYRRFSIPFGCLVFAALGVPLGIQPTRAVHSRGFSVSLLLIFAYYLLLTLGQNLGERGALTPPIAVWLPNLALSLVAGALLWRAVGDRDTSQSSVLERWRSFLRTRRSR